MPPHAAAAAPELSPAPVPMPPPVPPPSRRSRRGAGALSRVSPRKRGELTPLQVQRRRQLRDAAARLFAEFGAAAVGVRRVALEAHLAGGTAHEYYDNRDELLYDLLGEHVLTLNAAVCTAFDAAAPEGPGVQLEAVAAAWLAHVAQHRHAHRSLLFCGHLLLPDRRESLDIRVRVLMETMMEPVLAATPGLAERTASVESLLATLASLLNDTGFWPEPPGAEELRVRAQRIAGMIRAAARAEMGEGWPGLGGGPGVVAGPSPEVETSTVRRRWREVLACVAGGTEVVVTRRGKRVARVVGAE